MVVPRGTEIWLDVHPAAPNGLGFLSALDPDSIQRLSVPFAEVDVPQLRAISKLRGLRALGLRTSDEHLSELGVLPRLLHLNLDSRKGGKRQSLVHGVKWLGSLPELKSLDLSNWRLSDATIDSLPRCQKLEWLSIEIEKLKDQHLRALASIPRLRSLNLRRILLKGERRGINVTGLAQAAEVATSFAHFEKSPHLEKLWLSNFPVNATMLRGLSKAKSLRSLLFIGGKLAEDAPSGLYELRQIRKLQLPDADQVLSRKAAQALATLPELREWPELEGVDEPTLDVITQAGHIEVLELSAFGNAISRASVARLGNLKDLRWLKLSFFPIDDEGLTSLARLKSLECLKLWRTNVSGEGFRYLKDLPKLGSVSLGIREGVPPRLEALADLPHLTELNLCGDDLRPGDYEPLGRMHNLTHLQILCGLADDTTAARVAKLKRLDSLILDESMLSDRGLQSLSKLKTLERLTVSGVFTDDGIQQLSALPRLRFLELNSDHVTDAGLWKLRKANTALYDARCEHPLFIRGILSIDAQGFWRRGDAEDRRRLAPLEGRPAPALAVDNSYGSGGRKLTLDGLRGKVVLVDFWGVWCGSCIAALPNLQRVYNKYRERGFEIIGVHSTDDGDRMSQFAIEHKLRWPVAVDVANQTKLAYRVKAWPAMYLIDRQGTLRVAEPHPFQLEEQIERMLAEPLAPAQ